MNILTLPTVMLEHIFSFLPYDLISKNRVVCKDFDCIAQRMLNRGFQRIERRISSNLKAIKVQLPRRESERRFHPLSRHCDILTSVETRISMLNMAYNRFIEQGKCCFIPGKVLDEMLNVMAIIDMADPLPMAFEVLQELRDISGMAMEHFEEVVAPLLRQKIEDIVYEVPSMTVQSCNFNYTNATNGNSTDMTVWRETILRNNRAIIKLDKRCRLLTRKVNVYKRLMTYNKRVLAQKQLEQGFKIAELRKKVDEYEIKFKELSLASVFKKSNKETDIHDIIISSLPHAKDKNTLHRLKNFSSQIKLDPSTSNIGANKVRKGSPIIKPRRASVTLPSYKASDEANVDAVSLSDCSDSQVVDKCTDTSYEDSLNAIRDQLHQVLEEPSNKSKTVDRKQKSESTSKRSTVKSPWKDTVGDGSPKPGTSKNINDDNANKGRKRLFNDEDDQNDGYSGSGFQAKVQVLSKTIMKLIETISDNRNAKRRRANADESDQEE